MHLSDILVVVRGGGEVGTGVAYRLFRAGFTVLVTELAAPRTLRWGAALAQAVVAGSAEVEGVTARLAVDPMDGMAFSVLDEIPVVVDEGEVVSRMQPRIVVDARMAGRNLDTHRRDAPLVIGLGTGFTAGKDVHAVVEADHGPHQGRAYWEGAVSAATPEAAPGAVLAMSAGAFQAQTEIGRLVQVGDRLGVVNATDVVAAGAGVVVGLQRDGANVLEGERVAEIDATADPKLGFLISSRARAIGGGVLEAILTGIAQWRLDPPQERDLL